MEESKYKVGDIVRLNSGGPMMTIDREAQKDGIDGYICKWANGETLLAEFFREEIITTVEIVPSEPHG